MFISDWQQFFRRFWRAKTAKAEPPVVQDLQTRLQHLNERFPAEPCADAPHVTMHKVDCNELELPDNEQLSTNQHQGLNHWASKRASGTTNENKGQRRHAFEFEIDPVRAALKISESIMNSGSQSQSSQSNVNDIWTSQSAQVNSNSNWPRQSPDNSISKRTPDPFSQSTVSATSPASYPPSNSQPCPSPQFSDPQEHAQELRNRTNYPAISEAAIREMLRLEQSNKVQISRSLNGYDEEMKDTAHADRWDCLSYNSLFALPDQSRYGTTTEYEEDYEEDLLPYFTETLLLQEDELVECTDQDTSSTVNAPQVKPAAAEKGHHSGATGTESATNLSPYKNFSENALKLIAQKPETPAPTLKWLASHSNPHIRAAVAKNPSTPADTITVLAKDHEAGIRHSIAENQLSSMDALNLLIKDRNPLIAWRAQNTVSQIRETIKAAQRAKEVALQEAQKETNNYPLREAKIATTEETIAFLQVIARKTNTPARRLDDLARHADPRIRAAVAENANAPAEILWLLSKDADSAVKTKVTDNYNCPIEILEAMKEDEDAYVAYQAHSQLNRVLGSTFGDNNLRTATSP